jgi:hypothetical protein
VSECWNSNCRRPVVEKRLCAACERMYRHGWEDGWESANGRNELRYEPLPHDAGTTLGHDGTLGKEWRQQRDEPAWTEIGQLVKQIDREQRWRDDGDESVFWGEEA